MTSAGPIIMGVVTHTPLYVWAIFALIVFLGYQRTRDRVLPMWRLVLLPAVMAALSAAGIVAAGAAVLPAALAGATVGGVSGWLLEREGATRRLADGRLWLRGEWWSFGQVLVIFAIHYGVAVAGAISPALAAGAVFHLSAVFVSTLMSAMLLGRTLARLRVYFTALPAAA